MAFRNKKSPKYAPTELWQGQKHVLSVVKTPESV